MSSAAHIETISSSYICLIQLGQLVELDIRMIREERGCVGACPLLLSVRMLSRESGLDESVGFRTLRGLELDFFSVSGRGEQEVDRVSCPIVSSVGDSLGVGEVTDL